MLAETRTQYRLEQLRRLRLFGQVFRVLSGKIVQSSSWRWECENRFHRFSRSCGKGGKQYDRFPSFPYDRHFHGLFCRALGSQSFWRTVEVYLVGRLCPQTGVRASGVVELDVARDLASGFANRLVGVQVDVLVFERTPEALDEDVVAPAALAVHADLDAFFFEPPGEGFAGELTALIGVEDLGPAVLAQSLVQCFDAERSVHGDRQPPSQHAAAKPVDDRSQIDEAMRHGDIGNVHCPNLIGPRDRESAQQVEINPVPWRGFGGVRSAIESLDAHAPHQCAHVAATHFKTLMAEHVAQHAAAGERIVHVQFVDAPHQHQVGVRNWARPIVDRGAADLQQFRLSADGQLVFGVDHRFALNRPALTSAVSKKSFSSVSSPILACIRVTSTLPCCSALSSQKTPIEPSCNRVFQSVIWLGWTSNCWANSARVLSPFSAARATFALNVAVWFRRGRRVIVAPRFCHLNGCQGTTLPLIPLSESPEPAHHMTNKIATTRTVKPRNSTTRMAQRFICAIVAGLGVAKLQNPSLVSERLRAFERFLRNWMVSEGTNVAEA